MKRQRTSRKVGQLIRKYRRLYQLTQEELAERAGVHPTYIGLLERGKRSPGIEVLEQIANALEKTLPEFIAETEKI